MTRPIRIAPEIAIGTINPPVMQVGEAGTWTLECEMPENIPPHYELNLVLSGTRWVKGEMACQSHSPESENYVSAQIVDGEHLRGIPPGPDADVKSLMKAVFRVPEGGIPKGSKLRLIMGDTSHGSPGLMGPRYTMRDAFITIDVPQMAQDNAEHQGKYLVAFMLDFVGGALDHLRLLAPSQIATGEAFSLTLRPQDRFGNLSSDRPSRLAFTQSGKRWTVEVTEEMINPAGALEIGGFTVEQSGILKISVQDPDTGFQTESNPIKVTETSEENLYWGLIHEHTELSDGQGNIALCYANLRYGSRLDFGATSDHDHRYETTDEMWEMTCKAAKEHNSPGEFVSFLGYEWAKWRQNGDGDRNVYYLNDDHPMYRSETGEFDTPQKLFDILSKENALVIPHHPAYTGNFCDWKDHDPQVERLVEIYSIWGNSEMSADQGNPLPIRNARWNNPALMKHKGISPPAHPNKSDEKPVGFVQNALAQGWRVGFTGGGDMHLSHPGNDVRKGHPPTDYKAGLTGVWAADKTRESIWDALINRRCYATTSARMILRFSVNSHPMGSEFAADDKAREINLYVCGTENIQKVDIICNNQTVHTVSPDGQREIRVAWKDERDFQKIAMEPAKWCSKPFVFYYARILQVDGEMAWVSPVWMD